MENTTVNTNFLPWNISKTNGTPFSNDTVSTSKTPMSLYPPGYFVIPAEVMSRYRLIMYSAVIPVTALIGLIGNAISFLVLLRHKMPKTTKMVLLAVSVYDFLNLITAILFSMTGVATAFQYQPGLNAALRAYPIFGSYLMLVFGRISSMLIVVISMERFCAVFFPFKIKSIWSPKVMAACIVFCNIFSYLFFIPNSLEYQPKDIPIPNSSEVQTILVLTEIGHNRNLYATLYTCNMVISRIIPTFIVLTLNVAISVSLYHSRNKRSEMTSGKTDDDQRITRTLLSLSFVYLACMIPNALIILVRIFDFERPFPYNRSNITNFFTILFYWLEVVNSTVNFIIYIFSSEKMREEFRTVVGCGQHVSKYTSESIGMGSSIQTSVATLSNAE